MTGVERLRTWLVRESNRSYAMAPYSWLPFDRDLIARRCAYCDRPVFIRDNPGALDHVTDDHIVPQSLGGRRRDNLVAVCRQCNRDKGNSLWIVFLLSYPFGCRSGLPRGELAEVDLAASDRLAARRSRRRKGSKERRRLRKAAAAVTGATEDVRSSASDFRVEKLLKQKRWHNLAWPWEP